MLIELYLLATVPLLSSCVYGSENLRFEPRWKVDRETERIVSFPGVDPMPTFPMFSGYLDANADDHLFYWFAECENPESEHLVVWYNGGPGCSSLDGLFYEHGPFKFDEHTGKTVLNPHSWNKLAHVLYVESPVGVGFSYTTKTDKILDDNEVAKDNMAALESFFVKFPERRHDYLYISGESYAGVYVPTLARLIIRADGEMSANLQGLLIGNGLLDKQLNFDTLFDYAYYHGLIGVVEHEEIKRLCSSKEYHASDYEDYDMIDSECLHKLHTTQQRLYKAGLHIYNYAKDCTFNSELQNSHHQRKHVLHSTLHNNLQLIPDCTNVTFLMSLLNRADVQESIHAKLHGVNQWELCSDYVVKNYQRMPNYGDMSSVFKEIINLRPFLRIVLYYGDLDLACNVNGGEQFADRLGYEITTSWRKWTVDRDGTQQIAGFYKEYDGLTFIAFKAAGHMVPEDKPLESYHMLKRILDDEPL